MRYPGAARDALDFFSAPERMPLQDFRTDLDGERFRVVDDFGFCPSPFEIIELPLLG